MNTAKKIESAISILTGAMIAFGLPILAIYSIWFSSDLRPLWTGLVILIALVAWSIGLDGAIQEARWKK